jgi:hypothetical protein
MREIIFCRGYWEGKLYWSILATLTDLFNIVAYSIEASFSSCESPVCGGG